MKSLKGISLAVALLVAGSQVQAGFWSWCNENGRNGLRYGCDVAKTGANAGLGYGKAFFDKTREVFTKENARKACNACTKENARALGGSIVDKTKNTWNACTLDNAKDLGQKTLTYGKDHWKPMLIGTSIGTGAAFLSYGFYRFYTGIKNYFNKKAEAAYQNAVNVQDLIKRTVEEAQKEQEKNAEQWIKAQETAKQAEDTEVAEAQKEYESKLNIATGGNPGLFAKHLSRQ